MLGVLFVALAAASDAGRTAPIYSALRRRQAHPQRGGRRRFSRAVKVVAKPWMQLPLAAVASAGLRYCTIPGAFAVSGAAIGALLADKACKAIVRRERPPGYHGSEKYQSFPSGHTASTAAVTLTAARLLERAAVVPPPWASVGAVLTTTVVAETRFMLDEHWPSDLVGGALLGTAIALSARAATSSLKANGRLPSRLTTKSAGLRTDWGSERASPTKR